MNVNRHSYRRLKLQLKGFLPSLLSIFLPKVSNRVIISSEFNQYFNHCSKYLFLHLLESRSDLDVRFVINNDTLRKNLTQIYGDVFIETESWSGIFFALRAKSWITSSLETPVGGLFNAFNRVVVHLGHGAPLKAIGLGEKYFNPIKSIYYRIIRTNFSYFLSTSPVFDKAWSDCLGIPIDRVLRGAQCRNDNLYDYDIDLVKELEIDKGFSILYAPTWRPFESTEIFPFDDFDISLLDRYLKLNNITIYLRLHPNFESLNDPKLYKSDNIKIISKSVTPDINTILGSFDLLITDYSSIYIDFLITEKPIIFLPYDYDRYNKNIGFTIDYYRYTPGPKPKSTLEFISEVTKLRYDKSYFKTERRLVNSYLNPISRRCTEKTSDVVQSIIDGEIS